MNESNKCKIRPVGPPPLPLHLNIIIVRYQLLLLNHADLVLVSIVGGNNS